MHRHWISAAIFSLAVFPGVFSYAAQTRANLSVAANVQAIAAFQVQTAPLDLTVSAKDIRRGFIDIEQPVELVIRSNSEDGFALEIIVVDPILEAMVVTGLGEDAPLSAPGGTIIQHWSRPQMVTVELKFHFILAPTLTPGRYPWPLRLKVQPLQSI